MALVPASFEKQHETLRTNNSDAPDGARKNRTARSDISAAKWQRRYLETPGRQIRKRKERPLQTSGWEGPVHWNDATIRSNTQGVRRQSPAGLC
jgi:hypothetical protein